MSNKTILCCHTEVLNNPTSHDMTKLLKRARNSIIDLSNRKPSSSFLLVSLGEKSVCFLL